MSSQKPLAQGKYLLQKFPGKGGWTYAAIPEVQQNSENPFGWVKVKGTIDGFGIEQYKLMPMGEGRLFLPVQAAIRKTIKKQAGDEVFLTLFLDYAKVEIPQEILDCFDGESNTVYKTFLDFSEGEQKAYLDWVYFAKKEETKAGRILKMMERLRQKLKLHDKKAG